MRGSCEPKKGTPFGKSFAFMVLLLEAREFLWYAEKIMARKSVILFIVLWLPLQGVSAAVMPFCPHSLSSEASGPHGQEVDNTGHNHGPTDSGLEGTHDGHPSVDKTLLDLACDECGACHLACAAYLPPRDTNGTCQLEQVFQLRSYPSKPQLVLEQLLHPPKSRIA